MTVGEEVEVVVGLGVTGRAACFFGAMTREDREIRGRNGGWTNGWEIGEENGLARSRSR